MKSFFKRLLNTLVDVVTSKKVQTFAGVVVTTAIVAPATLPTVLITGTAALIGGQGIQDAAKAIAPKVQAKFDQRGQAIDAENPKR
jgi:hypothetical protein